MKACMVFLLVGWLMAASTTADPLNSCSTQEECIDWTIEKVEDGTSCGQDTCLYRVCLQYDVDLVDCPKVRSSGGSSTLSHACDSGDPVTECLIDDSNNNGWDARGSEMTNFPDDAYMCVYVPRGETAKFLMKDGNGCFNSRDDISVFGDLDTPSTVSCRPSEYQTCTGNPTGSECWWFVETPYDDCSSSGGNGNGDDAYACSLPEDTERFSVITKEDAAIAAHNIYTGLAIGGALSDPNPNISKPVDGMSYIQSIDGNVNFNWNVGKEIGVSLDAVIDFDLFEDLARSAQSSEHVFVLTNGGTFTTYDFNPDGQGSDNGQTLVIFNTNEDVILTKTPDGRQFGPSVIAPFSHVELKGDAGFLDGLLVARSFATTGGNAGNLQLHGKTYTGTITCTPVEGSENPSSLAPTAAPVCVEASEAVQLGSDCDAFNFDTAAIGITDSSMSQVTWTLTNWGAADLEWVMPVAFDSSTETVQGLDKYTGLAPGATTSSFTTDCVNGWSMVHIYTMLTADSNENKDVCDGWDPLSEVCRYDLQLACNICEEAPCVDDPTEHLVAQQGNGPTTCQNGESMTT